MAVGPAARLGARGLDPPRRMEEDVEPRLPVAQRVDLRAALGQDDDLEPFAAQRDGAPAGDRVLTQPARGGSQGCTSSR